MADLTRQDLDRIRREVDLWVGCEETECAVCAQPGSKRNQLLKLLAMAERAVSEETLMALALFIDAGKRGGPRESILDGSNKFLRGAVKELGPAAESLARKNGGEHG